MLWNNYSFITKEYWRNQIKSYGRLRMNDRETNRRLFPYKITKQIYNFENRHNTAQLQEDPLELWNKS